MAKSSPTVAALFCLLSLSLAEHAPPVDDAVSSRAAVHKVPVNHGKQLNRINVPTVPLNKITFRAINRRFPGHDSRNVEDLNRIKQIVSEREREINVLKKLKKSQRLENEEEETKLKKNGVFMRRVRKFLDQYF
ncbi:5-aminolevulinate synthase [Striga asiatica]|uniref:5-aminolevulinate synthase n=1 Tax=Striga asiatica TaxID=4170 RepID=A0A5A7Q9A7_STRAF|nr:5-aminolevulinate synthase [Striga asiatica]